VRLYRVFDWDGKSTGDSFGGPLFVYRTRQGSGRHDAPDLFGAWYLSQSAVSAVAESLQYLRGHAVTSEDFQRTGGVRKALVTLDLSTEDRPAPVDLDDPCELTARAWRPSGIATRHRAATQAVARALYEEGAVGFCWWSALEASWINLTLFHERALPDVTVAEPLRPLTLRLNEVRDAAERLGIRLGR
jgi:hypothetical protein